MLQELKPNAPYTLYRIKEGGTIQTLLLVYREYDPKMIWHIFTIQGTEDELFIMSFHPMRALIFEGHDVPILPEPVREDEIEPVFTFMTDDAQALREYIALHCYSCFPNAFASIFYIPMGSLNTYIPIPLFPALQ